VDVLTPVIVSASRATDIPALYGDWLLRRLRAGSCVWVNRFNGRRHRISFERTRVIVFWSKNPAPLIPRLGEIDALGINYYFTLTLNDYEQEGLEPGVPPLAERIETFRRLSGLVGPERVVWRFDPVVVGRHLTPEVILGRIARVGAAVHRHTRKLVISFADIERYPAARRRLGASGRDGMQEPGAAAVALIAAGIRELNRAWGLDLATCAETVDLAGYGIGRNRCVDDELMARAFPGDAALREFLGRAAGCEERPLGGVGNGVAHPLKDRGQRAACGCIVSKDIGRYGTCPHRCAYCYANASHAAAAAAHARHDPGAESL
jgi:hypothetical protein